MYHLRTEMSEKGDFCNRKIICNTKKSSSEMEEISFFLSKIHNYSYENEIFGNVNFIFSEKFKI